MKVWKCEFQTSAHSFTYSFRFIGHGSLACLVLIGSFGFISFLWTTCFMLYHSFQFKSWRALPLFSISTCNISALQPFHTFIHIHFSSCYHLLNPKWMLLLMNVDTLSFFIGVFTLYSFQRSNASLNLHATKSSQHAAVFLITLASEMQPTSMIHVLDI